MKEEKEISFFKKVIISIKDFEEYPRLASRNWSVVLAYMLKLLAIFTIFAVITFMFALITGNTNRIDANQQELLMNNLRTHISENFPASSETIIYIIIAIMVYVYMFLIYFVGIAIDVILLGAFGYFTAIILRLHLKYTAMCKIAAHSLTLPIILNATYMLIQAFTTFEIKYFEAMYIGVAYIYIITAILMIKSDILKNQEELTKILQEQERVRKELERQKQEEEAKKEEQKQKEEKERQRKKEKGQENNDEQNEKNDEEPQGENA